MEGAINPARLSANRQTAISTDDRSTLFSPGSTAVGHGSANDVVKSVWLFDQMTAKLLPSTSNENENGVAGSVTRRLETARVSRLLKRNRKETLMKWATMVPTLQHSSNQRECEQVTAQQGRSRALRVELNNFEDPLERDLCLTWRALERYCETPQVRQTKKVALFELGRFKSGGASRQQPCIILIDPRLWTVERMPKRFVFDVTYSSHKMPRKVKPDLNETNTEDVSNNWGGGICVGTLLTKESFLDSNQNTNLASSKFTIAGIVISTSNPSEGDSEESVGKALRDVLLSLPSNARFNRNHPLATIITADMNRDLLRGLLDTSAVAASAGSTRFLRSVGSSRIGIQISFFHVVAQVLGTCRDVGVVNVKMNEDSLSTTNSKVVPDQQKRVVDLFKWVCQESHS
jgi:hypothetical protein